MSDEQLPVPRAEIYRAAGRAFPYPAYLALDLAWIVAAVYLLFGGLIRRDPSMDLVAECVAIAAAILHNLKMLATAPRLTLRPIQSGAGAYIVVWLVARFMLPGFAPVPLAVLVATGHFMWIGEAWTNELYRRQAAKRPNA